MIMLQQFYFEVFIQKFIKRKEKKKIRWISDNPIHKKSHRIKITTAKIDYNINISKWRTDILNY